MEQNLQTVLDLINGDANLSPDEKAVIIARLNAADKKMSVDAFRIERGEHLKKTMSTLLDETIEELEQKRRAVEEKNRDLEIEAALERARTVAMGMRAADDLLDICKILFEELTALGFTELRNAMINIVNDEKGSFLCYDFNGDKTSVVPFQYNSHPVIERQVSITRSAGDAFIEHILTGNDLEDFKAFRVRNGEAPDPKLENISALYYYFYSIGIGSVGISTFSSLTEGKLNVLKRFRNVFDLAYRRYADIQLAAAQAREAQIELALERVRARTMAMQHSDELAETAFILFQQFKELGENPDQATIGIINEEEHVIEYWVTMYGSQINKVFKFSIDELNVTNKIYKAWKAKEKSLVIDLSGKALLDFTTYRASMGGTGFNPAEKRRVINVAFFSSGLINVQSNEARSAESIRLLERFAKVFEQTYTRFLDLKKSEAQVREAQIEAALERTRTQSMIMQHSSELDDTLRVFHQQVLVLGIKSAFSFLWLPDEKKDRHIFWAAWVENNSNEFKSKAIDYPLDRNEPATAQCLIDWKGNDPVVSYHVPPEGVAGYFAAWQELIEGVEQLKPEYFKGGLYYVEAFMKYGCFGVMVESSLSPEENKILGRFAIEFERTYTRFLDLQKAEAQARESQIQLGLERVRAAAMAMHDSNDVGNATALVFSELYKLGITTIRCGVCIIDGATQQMEVWSASSSQEGGVNRGAGKLDMTAHPLWIKLLNAWKQKKSTFTYELAGKELTDYYKAITNAPDYHAPDNKALKITPDNTGSAKQYCNCFLFNEGCVFAFTQAPFSPKTSQVLEKFTAVFGITYRRYLDLQKAEDQARESQIQLALERVRARTMAMQKSEELHEVIQLVFDQLQQLNFNIDVANFALNYKETDDFDLLLAVPHGKYPMEIHVPYFKHPVFDRFNKAKKKGNLLIDALTKDQKDSFFEHFFKYVPGVSEETKASIFGRPGFVRSAVLMRITALTIHNYDGIPYSEAENNTLLRFGQVFDQTYTRFKDLEQAEEQARESQIQLGLERVRAKAMAMQTSEELNELIGSVFSELTKLDFVLTRCLIMIFDPETKASRWWMANSEAPAEPMNYLVQNHKNPAYDAYLKAWKERNLKWNYTLKGKVKRDWDDFLFVDTELAQLPVPVIAGMKAPEQVLLSASFNNFGCLTLVSLEPLSDEHSDIMLRFAKVFDMCYTRFNDLQRAEAQVREGQIEAALERVRSKTMAMHNSDDVADTVAVMFNELIKLGVEKAARCGIAILDEASMMELWTARFIENEKADLVIGHIDMHIHPMLMAVYDAWKNKESSFSYELAGDDLSAYITAINSYPDYPIRYDISLLGSKQFNSDFFFPEGMLFVFTSEPFDEGISSIFKRFAGVFGQTYRRYLDLQKAEAAAREAQIEAALERVRSKAMAMRSSGDLNDTANTVFIELRKLGVDLVRCGLGLMGKETHISTIHAATNSDEGGSLEVLGNLDLSLHPVMVNIYEYWEQGRDYFPVLEGESLKVYYEKLAENGFSIPEWKSGEKQYGYFLQFAYGSLYAWSGKQESEITIKTLKRFTSVISLTYTRYIELQKAELTAKEAVKQASLDRVRAEIASMRKRSDLERITPLIWDELTILGIPFIRCGVFIMDEEQRLIHTFLSTPDGKAIGAFHVPFDTSGNFEKMVACWRSKEPYIDHWKEEAFSQFADTLVKQGAIASKAQYMRTLPHEGVHLNFLPFLQGMLYVGNIEPLAEDNINLIQAVADAFSTAYARYEDFNKLEAAKQQVDNTLSDLKNTQTKLIQSEKMASLGELTAGIAHEIQNPLNFVNNFSEVNQEMIDELADELKAGNIEEALAIAADIKDNEQKINHHGKRADGIVKGMLQHSRTGGGEKQQTNINALADEFMRLSYHGLRAKDKVFNAELVAHFDPDLPKISVIGQDIGRVLLNLFNNAFYAVNQKKKALNGDYKPEVVVTTLTENGQVIIKVKDNGTGISDAIKEKIMQPFFTTKPTGEGTGLGLSLTYDMVVKGHGGTIQVNSQEGEYSEFIISLPLS